MREYLVSTMREYFIEYKNITVFGKHSASLCHSRRFPRIQLEQKKLLM